MVPQEVNLTAEGMILLATIFSLLYFKSPYVHVKSTSGGYHSNWELNS